MSVAPLLAVGGPNATIDRVALEALVHGVLDGHVSGAKRVLLVPPDQTRLHSRAGEITAITYEVLTARGCEVAILPALGTHTPMTPDDASLLFGDGIPYARILHHDWRSGLVALGEISAEEISALSNGRFNDPIPAEIDAELFNNWDVIISIGQVVPHEVIGMANFTKNLVIGLGGAPNVHRSHFLGAVSGMETIMGRPNSPVRTVVDAAFDRFLADRIKVLWVLTVMEDIGPEVVQRGLFVGHGTSTDSGGAAYRAAADLAAACNITVVDQPFKRVACWLDPSEFRTTWLGNKAIYRTRMAVADDGELIVLAPGVHRFGEDLSIDALIRRHGYRGTPETLRARTNDPDLEANLAAAAHLIHGSSEGRFRITYCTNPADGGLTRDEVESVGYDWRPLTDELAALGVSGTVRSGRRTDSHGAPFDFIANPALGLWTSTPIVTTP